MILPTPSRQEAEAEDAPPGATRCPFALRPEPSAGALQDLIIRGIEGRRILHDDTGRPARIGPLSGVHATVDGELVTRLGLLLAHTARHPGVSTSAGPAFRGGLLSLVAGLFCVGPVG